MAKDDFQPWSDDEIRGIFDKTVRRFILRFWTKSRPDPEVQRFLKDRDPSREIGDEPAYPGRMTRCIEVLIDGVPHVIFARLSVTPKADLPEVK